MRKITFTVLLTAFATIAFGQITTTKVAPKIEQIDIPYDSTQNFLKGDIYKYIGQELYVKGKSEGLREYGYEGFSKDYTMSTLGNISNVYKCCDSYNSKYDSLVEKYFKVIDIVTTDGTTIPFIKFGKDYNKKYFLKLVRKDNSDTVYYHYDGYEHSFPFIVVGFFEKQQKNFVSREFVFNDSEFKDATDIQTGKTVTIKTGQKWKCVDLTIEDKYYNLSLIFENSLGEKTANEYDRVLNVAYTAKEADSYKKKFGETIWNTILTGKVKIGMTKEMCKLSWGEPHDINQTTTSGKTSEQWVYSDNYLYFDKGILTAIQ